MPRLKETTEFVRHNYTPEERLKMGEDLAGAHNRMADIESEESVIKAQVKEKKSQVEQTVAKLSRELSTGFTMENIRCKLAYGEPNPLEVTYRRIDTNEVVKVRAMNSDEMQEELPLTDREGEVVAIPPAEAEANIEKSAENIAGFFEAGKQMAEMAPQDEFVDEVGPLPEDVVTGVPSSADLDAVAEEQQVADATGTPMEELFTEEYIDEKGSPVALPAKPKPRKPRGFDKPTNESAW